MILGKQVLRPGSSSIPESPSIRLFRRYRYSLPRTPFQDPNFRPPPIRERLRPLVPFLIWWTTITSLAVHLLRTRQRSKEELGRASAQISVLESLLSRQMKGDELSANEIRRELEMVGLRTRRNEEVVDNVGEVSWLEAIMGRRRQKTVMQDDTPKNEVQSLSSDAQRELEATKADKEIGDWATNAFKTEPKDEENNKRTGILSWFPTLPKMASLPSSGVAKRAPNSDVYIG